MMIPVIVMVNLAVQNFNHVSSVVQSSLIMMLLMVLNISEMQESLEVSVSNVSLMNPAVLSSILTGQNSSNMAVFVEVSDCPESFERIS